MKQGPWSLVLRKNQVTMEQSDWTTGCLSPKTQIAQRVETLPGAAMGLRDRGDS